MFVILESLRACTCGIYALVTCTSHAWTAFVARAEVVYISTRHSTCFCESFLFCKSHMADISRKLVEDPMEWFEDIGVDLL